jgi:integrase/recombinase XerC
MGMDRDETVIRRHIDWLRRTGATPITQNYRRGVLDRLARTLPAGLVAATPDDLDAWQAGLTVSISTIAGYTSHVRCFYRWAVEYGVRTDDPTVRLPRTKVPKRRPRPVPDADLRVALACASEPIRTWMVLAAFLGLRAMEIAGMKREDVVELDGRLYLDGIGKGSKAFRLPIPEHVVPVLRPHLTGRGGALWRTAPGGRPSRPLDVSAQAAAFFRKIGMPYTLHQLRHSFGTAIYRQTRDLLLTQDAMRHSTPTMTRLYVETTAPAAAAAMDRLSASLEDRRRRGRRTPA